ncbi:hypothetical protein [Microvirga yunnanensis]|uniref:hypothetical protein n=1 Tax=Microvirga yunnanensis TaxID=2953740 RepID=UPI0021C8D453|nr:hypothetical protein [Microvirga sp. HBU65207]
MSIAHEFATVRGCSVEMVRGDKSMDQNTPSLGTELEPSSMFDTTLRIGLVAVLVYACARIVLPLAFILPWSAILAVMLYPLHLCAESPPVRADRPGWRAPRRR